MDRVCRLHRPKSNQGDRVIISQRVFGNGVRRHSVTTIPVMFKITKPAMCRPLLTLGFDETLKSRRIFAAVTCLRD